MINISLFESKIISKGNKKEIEKKRGQIKKPKTLSDFKNYLLSEFNTNNLNYITIYSIDMDGEPSEVKEEEDYTDEDCVAFKIVYDESNPIKDDNKSIKSDNNERKDEEENNDKNNESIGSIDENELLSILDEELKDEKKEDNNKFESKIFNKNLLDEFLQKQEELINRTKLTIDREIENIMTEKSQMFTDLKNIPQINETIVGTTKKIIEVSKINKSNIVLNQPLESIVLSKENEKKDKDEEKKDGENNQENIEEKKDEKIIIKDNNLEEEDESDDEEQQNEIKFVNNEIKLEKTVNEAKWINIENVSFQNMSSNKYSAGDLYFYRGDKSSKEITFLEKQNRIDICFENDLSDLEVSKDNKFTLRIEEPQIDKTYFCYIYIKSDKYEIKMTEPLKIEVLVIKNKNPELSKSQIEKLKKKKLEEEEEQQKKEKERLKEEENRKRIEQENIEKERKKQEEEQQIKEKERLEEENRKRIEQEKERLKEEEKRKKMEQEKEEEKEEEKEKEKEEEKKGDEDDDVRLNLIFAKLEEEYYISSFKQEDEVKEKIKELNYNEDEIISWVESIM